MSKKILACDIDEVLWDMIPTWCDEYNKISQNDRKITINDLTEWDIKSVVGEEESTIFYNLLKQESTWDKVVANQDKDILYKTYNRLVLLSEKYELYIATATSYKNTYKLNLFLNLFDCLDEDRLILINDKWLINADIIIDDNPNILEKCNKKRTRCVKINKPWNTWFECENYDSFVLAADKLLKEVL